MVLRRLAGKTENTAPVLTLITQFGGGKTHTLTALYHLVRHGTSAADDPGVAGLLEEADLPAVPEAKVGVFVGNAWDPQNGRETPWIDLAWQLAGDMGVTYPRHSRENHTTGDRGDRAPLPGSRRGGPHAV